MRDLELEWPTGWDVACEWNTLGKKGGLEDAQQHWYDRGYRADGSKLSRDWSVSGPLAPCLLDAHDSKRAPYEDAPVSP